MPNREIKVRVYHKTLKGGYMYELGDGTYLGVDGELWEGGYDGVELCSPNFQKDILMQYTGLKDKNEKHIFEGDILLIGEAEVEKRKVEIYFDEGGFRAKWGDQKTIELSTYCNPTFKNCNEIIGNVHEQPELINKE